MTESGKKKPPVMSMRQAEMRRAVARKNVVLAWEDRDEKEAKKAKKKTDRPVMLFTGPRAKRVDKSRDAGEIDVTGRDGYILSEALATAITALSRLEHPPESNIADMKEILAEWYPTGGFGYLIESAERRLETLLPST